MTTYSVKLHGAEAGREEVGCVGLMEAVVKLR